MKKLGDVVWKGFECENSPTDSQTRKQKLFERYVDDIICTVRDNPNNLVHLGSNLNKKMEF